MTAAMWWKVRQHEHALRLRLDLLRSLGVSHAVRRRRANTRHRHALVERRDRVSEEMWRDAAHALDANVTELSPTLLEFRLGAAVVRIRGQTTPFADPVSSEVADDKALAYRLLARAGLQIPEYTCVASRDFKGAVAFLEAAAGPCIVKPLRGAGGAGVTGEIRTRAHLRRALHAAGRIYRETLLERQVDGDSYRLLILDGRVLDVLRRSRPRIIGDGRSTIEQLMFREYDERIEREGPAGLKPFVVDLDCLFTLEGAGKDAQTVVPAGESVVVKTATNYNGPAETFVLPRPWPKTLVEPARGAAEALGVRLGGVDIVAPTVDRSLAESGGVILEVNAVPGLTHHYNVGSPADGNQIAVAILRDLFAGAANGAHS